MNSPLPAKVQAFFADGKKEEAEGRSGGQKLEEFLEEARNPDPEEVFCSSASRLFKDGSGLPGSDFRVEGGDEGVEFRLVSHVGGEVADEVVLADASQQRFGFLFSYGRLKGVDCLDDGVRSYF